MPIITPLMVVRDGIVHIQNRETAHMIDHNMHPWMGEIGTIPNKVPAASASHRATGQGAASLSPTKLEIVIFSHFIP